LLTLILAGTFTIKLLNVLMSPTAIIEDFSALKSASVSINRGDKYKVKLGPGEIFPNKLIAVGLTLSWPSPQ
jgi:hypothetical protein